jgi:hypothetical protein
VSPAQKHYSTLANPFAVAASQRLTRTSRPDLICCPLLSVRPQCALRRGCGACTVHQGQQNCHDHPVHSHKLVSRTKVKSGQRIRLGESGEQLQGFVESRFRVGFGCRKRDDLASAANKICSSPRPALRLSYARGIATERSLANADLIIAVPLVMCSSHKAAHVETALCNRV